MTFDVTNRGVKAYFVQSMTTTNFSLTKFTVGLVRKAILFFVADNDFVWYLFQYSMGYHRNPRVVPEVTVLCQP